nr:hypothetical protein [uncultured Flavobacterium sp.]
MIRTFLFFLTNTKTKKQLKRKAKGETRMLALAFLSEKFKHPENYIVDDVTSVAA